MRRLFPLIFILASIAAPSYADEVLCAAVSGYTECRVGLEGTIALTRDLTSERKCIEGVTWGMRTAGVVWVSGGCRATFTIAEASKQKTIVKSVTCKSSRGKRVECPADTKFGVAIAKRQGDAECILDESWGFDDKSIWVSAGCHASFALGGFRLPLEAVPPTALRLTCESKDGKRTDCPVDTARGVGLIRQLDEKMCALNRTWGYDGAGVWVDGGCRAEFAVAR